MQHSFFPSFFYLIFIYFECSFVEKALTFLLSLNFLDFIFYKVTELTEFLLATVRKFSTSIHGIDIFLFLISFIFLMPSICLDSQILCKLCFLHLLSLCGIDVQFSFIHVFNPFYSCFHCSQKLMEDRSMETLFITFFCFFFFFFSEDFLVYFCRIVIL